MKKSERRKAKIGIAACAIGLFLAVVGHFRLVYAVGLRGPPIKILDEILLLVILGFVIVIFIIAMKLREKEPQYDAVDWRSLKDIARALSCTCGEDGDGEGGVLEQLEAVCGLIQNLKCASIESIADSVRTVWEGYGYKHWGGSYRPETNADVERHLESLCEKKERLLVALLVLTGEIANWHDENAVAVGYDRLSWADEECADSHEDETFLSKDT